MKLGTQKGQDKVQNNVDLTILNNNSFDVKNCAYCKHKFAIPIGTDINEVIRYNNKLSKLYHTQISEWANTPTKKRGVKPRYTKLLS